MLDSEKTVTAMLSDILYRNPTLTLQVADHVRAHWVWRHVCYKNGQIPTEAPVDTTLLVDRKTTRSTDTGDL